MMVFSIALHQKKNTCGLKSFEKTWNLRYRAAHTHSPFIFAIFEKILQASLIVTSCKQMAGMVMHVERCPETPWVVADFLSLHESP